MVCFGEQLRGDGQVDGGRGGVDVAHERRELVEPRRRIETLPIPPQQASHGEGMTQGVKMGRRDTVGNREGQLDDESMERLTRGARVHAAPAVEACLLYTSDAADE